jgi:hypothetical protein
MYQLLKLRIARYFEFKFPFCTPGTVHCGNSSDTFFSRLVSRRPVLLFLCYSVAASIFRPARLHVVRTSQAEPDISPVKLAEIGSASITDEPVS